MCGVIGYSPSRDADLEKCELLFKALAEQSRIRGTHCYGVAHWSDEARSMHVAKGPDLDFVLGHFAPSCSSIFHARYSTSGDWRDMKNNQPIVLSDWAIAMNGVIHMGTKKEMEDAFGVILDSENDAEIPLRKIWLEHESEPIDALDEFVRDLTGSFAGVLLRQDRLYALRNARRPLWRARGGGAHWFASTRDVFLRAGFEASTIEEVQPGGVYCV